ncbi:hypothetical protein ACMHYB_14605 [Sorangium sp. So ce1128]
MRQLSFGPLLLAGLLAAAEPVTGFTLDPDHRLIDRDISAARSASPAPRPPVWIF